jgi:transposase
MKKAQILQEKEAENALLRAEIFNQKQVISQKVETITGQSRTIAALEEQVMLMQARIAWFARQKFGQKRERFVIEDPNQLTLDLGFDPGENKPEVEPEKETINYTRKKKKHPGRKALPEELPRKEIIIEPANKTDEMIRIGEEVTEKLAQVPAQLFVLRYIRPKYVKKGHDGVTVGDLPEFALPKSIADASVLASILVGKYLDHLPLHRQRAIYGRAGIQIAESTIGNWVDQSAKLLEPLYDALAHSVTKTSGYVQADESHIQVLDSKKNGKSHRGYMWLYLDPKDKLVLFDYQHSRQHYHPHQRLKDFQGILQSDGYDAYTYFDNKPGIIHLHCMAHARRKFFDAKNNDPTRAAHFLTEVKKLYKIEEELRDQQADDDARKLIRQAEARPILEKLGQWLINEYPKVLPKSSIGQAIAYSLKRWKTLSAYIDYGMAEIDNNLVENQVRPLALGRKNYLFAGSQRAAKNAAICYSIIASAKINGLNPFHYLYTVLRRIPTQPINRIQELLPYNFQPTDLQTGPHAKINIE